MATAKRDERWMAEVADALTSGLRAKAETARKQGRGLAELGSPAEVAERMLETVPIAAPSPWEHVGPFYSGKGVARMLGGVTRQAVDDRRRRNKIVALRTTDGVWLYPTFQFGPDGTVDQRVVTAFCRLRDGGAGDWMAGSIMVTPQHDLDGRGVADHLHQGHDPERVTRLVDRAVARWRH